MKLKKLDYVVIAALIIFTLGSFIITLNISNKKYSEKYVEIEVKGQLYKRLPLNNTNETIPIQSDLGNNIIEIVDGKVHVKDADCPDKICVKDGFISTPGQILVCLPNKVVIQIKGNVEQELDDISS